MDVIGKCDSCGKDINKYNFTPPFPPGYTNECEALCDCKLYSQAEIKKLENKGD